MKSLIPVIVSFMMLSSCGTTALYYWGGTSNGVTKYEQLAYKSYNDQTPESICKLIVVYEDMVTHPKGTRNVPPPGICAEYGYLLLNPDTAELFAKHATFSQRSIFDSSDYHQLFRQRGEEMMEKEMAFYPESTTFIAPLIKRLTE